MIGRSAAGIALATTLSLAAGSAAFAGPPEGGIRGADAGNVVRGSYLVVLKDGAASPAKVQASAATLTATFGGTVTFRYTRALRGFSARMSDLQARRMAARPEVGYVQAVRKVKKSDTQANPPSWGLDRIDQGGRPESHSYTYPSTASAVHAYIIDTGIRTDRLDFGGRAGSGIDTVDNDTDASDCDGHGTHVAGTVGGATFGVAKQVQLVAVRVLDCAGWGTDAQIVAGIDWVTANAVHPAVANMSLGSVTVDPAIDAAVANSIASGITYAVAAGNGGADGVGDDACTTSPADVPGAIAVGATDEADFRTWFSNYGPCVAVFAPGNKIASVNLDSDATPRIESGTSQATPHVTGAAALLLAANPLLTPAQVRAAIVDSAVPDTVYHAGTGSPNRLLHMGTAPNSPSISLLARINSRFVTTGGGADPLSADRSANGLWEEFDQVDEGGGYVALRSHANGRYVTAEAGGSQPLVANRAAVGAWEKFRIMDNGDGSVALQANANNRFVTTGGGTSALIANRSAVGLWEEFDRAGPVFGIAFQSFANDKIITAEAAGSAPLQANRAAVGQWEQFDEVNVGGGYIALRARANGKFVTAEWAGTRPLIANRTSAGAWEKFQVIDLGGDGTGTGTLIALLANADGQFVSTGFVRTVLVADGGNDVTNLYASEAYEDLTV